MDHNKLASEVSRGEKAKLLLDEPLIKEAFETLKKEFQEMLKNQFHPQLLMQKITFNMILTI